MSESSRPFVLAHCGLVCSNCGMYVRGKCQGCHGPRPMNSRCAVKRCCLDRGLATCAECEEFEDLGRCRNLNNLVSKLFGLVFRSDRIGSLRRIREIGAERFAAEIGERKSI